MVHFFIYGGLVERGIVIINMRARTWPSWKKGGLNCNLHPILLIFKSKRQSIGQGWKLPLTLRIIKEYK